MGEMDVGTAREIEAAVGVQLVWVLMAGETATSGIVTTETTWPLLPPRTSPLQLLCSSDHPTLTIVAAKGTPTIATITIEG